MPDNTESGGGRPADRFGQQPLAPHHADDAVFDRHAPRRNVPSQGQRHRQQTHGDPCSPGQGRPDRDVLFSPKLLETLREYWRWMKPKKYLFPGQRRQLAADVPLTAKIVWHACRRRRSGPASKSMFTPTRLRHSLCHSPAGSRRRPAHHSDCCWGTPRSRHHVSTCIFPSVTCRRCPIRWKRSVSSPEGEALTEASQDEPAHPRGGRHHSRGRQEASREQPVLADMAAPQGALAPSSAAARQRSAVIKTSALAAAIRPSRTTHAATGIARSARPTPATGGWLTRQQELLPVPTSTSSSRCRTNSRRWPSTTRSVFYDLLFRASAATCWRSRPIPSTWVRRSVS